jgi:hypothetical protein
MLYPIFSDIYSIMKIIITEKQFRLLKESEKVEFPGIEFFNNDWDMVNKMLDKFKYKGQEISNINDLKKQYYNIEIDIEKADYGDKYNVEYSLEINNTPINISGQLVPYHSGRSTDYTFEPSYFVDDESQNYFDENWEEIEDQILDQFYNQ